MPNQRILLTEAHCMRARPEKREYALRDLRQPNLTLRIRPTGSKTWIVRHYVDGEQVRVSLGSYPDITVKAARQATNAVLSGISSPQPKARAMSFGEFQAEHERRHGATLKPSGLRSYRSYIHNQLLPAFGMLPLVQIGRVDVVRWFERYSLRSPGGANRALGILSQMIECAKAWGSLPADWINPVTGIRHNRRAVIGTFLSGPQLTRLGTIFADRARNGCIASAALRFLTLTGCRVSEATSLQWRDIAKDRLRLRDSKTGARDVPIGSPVRRFLSTHSRLRALPRARAPNSAVFPLPPGKEYESVRSVWHAVRRDADLPRSLRIHDLRHSFASHAIMSGESLFTVSRLLGHSRIQTTARYAHLADEALADCAETIGGQIMSQVASIGKARSISARTRPRSPVLAEETLS